MRRIIAVLTIGLSSLVACDRVQGAIISPSGTYTFAGTDPSGDLAVPSQTGMTYGSFSRAKITQVSAPDVFSSAGYTAKNTIQTADYVQFALTPTSGNSLSLAYLTFNTYRDANGPTSGEVRIFLGTPANDAAPYQANQGFTIGTTSTQINFNFTDFNTAINQGVTVRLYGFSAGNNNGVLSFDDVGINVVPEPVNVALGIFAGVLVVGGVAQTRAVRNRIQRWRNAVVQWVDAV